MIEGTLSANMKKDRLFLLVEEEVRTQIEPYAPLTIFLAGQWITGIFHPIYDDFWDLLEYRLECPDGSYCGLLSGMKARLPNRTGEVQKEGSPETR